MISQISMGQEPDKSHGDGHTVFVCRAPTRSGRLRVTQVRYAPDRRSDKIRQESVQTFAKLFAGFEIGNLFLTDRDGIPGTRITPDTGIALFDGKCAKAAKLDPVATRKRISDLVKDRGNNPFNVALIEMRIHLGKAGDQFRFCHFQAPSC